jgi:hypothetical protein
MTDELRRAETLPASWYCGRERYQLENLDPDAPGLEASIAPFAAAR